jgi:hypothetical protein
MNATDPWFDAPAPLMRDVLELRRLLDRQSTREGA